MQSNINSIQKSIQKQPWHWHLCLGGNEVCRGVVMAMDPRDALSRAMTTSCLDPKHAEGPFVANMVAEVFDIPVNVLDQAPGNDQSELEVHGKQPFFGDDFTICLKRKDA